MENATKALLIAGSILVAILLIAVGLRIFNSTNGTSESAKTTMQTTAVATFNTQFVAYTGKNRSRTDALTLLNTIISNNSSNSKHKISYTIIKKDGTTLSESSSTTTDFIVELNKHERYNINSTTNSEGYIDTIEFNVK